MNVNKLESRWNKLNEMINEFKEEEMKLKNKWEKLNNDLDDLPDINITKKIIPLLSNEECLDIIEESKNIKIENSDNYEDKIFNKSWKTFKYIHKNYHIFTII